MADIHVLPINDAIEHKETHGCWCHPTVEIVSNGATVVVHHSADGRETTEPDAVYPPAARY